MRSEAIVWFGFRVLGIGCRSTAKGAPWASFRRLSGIEKKIAPSEPARHYFILFLQRWTEQQPQHPVIAAAAAAAAVAAAAGAF
jgi:hypothetical protein